MRPFLLAGGLGLMWFALAPQDGVDADAPVWGVAIVLAVRLLVDFVGGWVAVSFLRLAFALCRLGLGQLSAHRQRETS